MSYRCKIIVSGIASNHVLCYTVYKEDLPTVADFATRLRELRKRNNLRQIDLARELGVAQTTIANYEQHSRFPDEETLGRIAGFFDVSLDYLLGRVDILSPPRTSVAGPAVDTPELSREGREYLETLLKGDKERAFDSVLEMVRNGESPGSIYRSLLTPALYEVGRRWERNEVDVSDEHFVSAATLTLMGRLHPFFERPEKKLGTVVALTAGGELHEIGIRMVSDHLEETGWECFLIGSNVPTASVYRALVERNADLLAISVTMERAIDSAENIIAHVKSAANGDGGLMPKIIVGGQAFSRDPDIAPAIGADGYARTPEELKTLLRTLYPDRR